MKTVPQIFDDLLQRQSYTMSNSKTSNPDQPATDSAKSKKTAPINHVILKRIGDLKTLVADLADSNEDKAMAGLDLGQEIHKQTSEIEALRNELHKFQSGILGSFCAALDERLIQPAANTDPPAKNGAPKDLPKTELREDSEAAAKTALTKNSGTPDDADTKDDSPAGLNLNSWESIRSAFLEEHEIETDTVSSTASKTADRDNDNSAISELGTVEREEGQSLNSLDETLPTHTDNVEDTEDDLDFKHSDIIADLDSLDETTLRSVVEKQEQLILGLIRRLRTRYNNRPTMTCEQLESVQGLADEGLAEEIRNTLAVLHSQQRQGELELSLERAKLSRRKTELEQLEARIEGRARTLGVTINENGDLEDASVAERGTGTKSRRWLGAMGFGNS